MMRLWRIRRVRVERMKIGKRRKGSKEYRETKEAARGIAKARLEYFNQTYHFSYAKVFIRNQKTRWGACSAKGNLGFNYRIAHLPPALADYVIVHELCHLGEFNHSPAFWALVARTIPNHKALRKALRTTYRF